MHIGPLGMPEIIIILVVVLLIFGPKNLPKLGKAIGASLKRASLRLPKSWRMLLRHQRRKPRRPSRESCPIR